MPKVIHVKKARKANKEHGIKVGDEYWWASFRRGASSFKRFWKSPPRRSQLTQSETLSEVYSLQEEIEDYRVTDKEGNLACDIEDLKAQLEQWALQAEEIGSTCQDKLDNMPEGLQQGDSGQRLQEYIDAMEQWASDLQSIDLDDADEDEKDFDLEDYLNQKLEEINATDPGV